MSDWENIKEKRTRNIGFISRTNAFRDPTPAEKAAALAKEIESWQKTKGKRPYSLSNEYEAPIGHGINLKRTREPGGKLDGPEYNKAIYSYVTTPMDHFNILESHGIDVSRYERPPSFWEKIKDWFKFKFYQDYEIPRVRLTKEFLETFSIKDKK